MFILLFWLISNSDIISNERLLTLAGVKVEQLQEEKAEKKQERMRLGSGVLLWNKEDHPRGFNSCSGHSLTPEC